jgi:transcriptional regulator with XRE-family HTH domain
MPNDADRAGTPAGVFGAELRFYRTRAALSQKDLATLVHVSNDVISKIETGERPPAEDFPPRLDAIPELDTRDALTRLWDSLKKGQKQRLYGWFQEWADIEAQATVLRWYEPLVVPGLLQTEDYARAILSARPDGNLDDLDEQLAARLARRAIFGPNGCAPALVHPRACCRRGRPVTLPGPALATRACQAGRRCSRRAAAAWPRPVRASPRPPAPPTARVACRKSPRLRAASRARGR